MERKKPIWKKVDDSTIEVEGVESLTCEALGGEFVEGKCRIKLQNPPEEKEEIE